MQISSFAHVTTCPALYRDFKEKSHDIWVIDQVWGQDGWIFAKLFFCVCSWTETKSRSINSQKKEWGQYPAILTEQTWSIKDLLYQWLSGKFFLWNTVGSPEQARWFHLAHSGSQSHRAIWFILLAFRSSRIIRLLIISSLFFSAPTQSQQTLITRQSLELGAELGQGEFGSVLKGVWRDPKGNKVKENFQLGWRNFLTCLFQSLSTSNPTFALLPCSVIHVYPSLSISISDLFWKFYVLAQQHMLDLLFCLFINTELNRSCLIN